MSRYSFPPQNFLLTGTILDWQDLTAEVLWKLVDVLQSQESTVSAFEESNVLSSFKCVCSQWRQVAGKGA